jgi:hypothetical protein
MWNWIVDTLMFRRGFGDWYTLSFYFFPILLNIVVGVYQLWYRIQEDLKERKSREESIKKDASNKFRDYHRYLTVGDIIYDFFWSICPVTSMWVALFDSIPYLAMRIYKRFNWLFDMRIVRDTDDEIYSKHWGKDDDNH